jgi:hypothetical protein
MAKSENATERMNQKMSESLSDAKMVGYNQSGEMCVWDGGWHLTVYDGSRQWSKKRVIRSDELMNETSKLRRVILAQKIMEDEGFNAVM